MRTTEGLNQGRGDGERDQTLERDQEEQLAELNMGGMRRPGGNNFFLFG